MNPRFVRLRPEFTVDEAIRYVRIQGRDLAQPIGDAYVLDLEQRLLGIVSPLERFSWPVDRTIDGLMRTDRIRYRNWREFAGAYSGVTSLPTTSSFQSRSGSFSTTYPRPLSTMGQGQLVFVEMHGDRIARMVNLASSSSERSAHVERTPGQTVIPVYRTFGKGRNTLHWSLIENELHWPFPTRTCSSTSRG